MTAQFPTPHSDADPRPQPSPYGPTFGDGPQDRRRSDDAPGPRYVRAEPIPARTPFGGPGPQPGVPLILPRKSLLLAVALAALLGPFGMVYSTLIGAFVMVGVWFWTLFLAPHLVPGIWVWGMVWALWSAHRKNERRRALEAYAAQW